MAFRSRVPEGYIVYCQTNIYQWMFVLCEYEYFNNTSTCMDLVRHLFHYLINLSIIKNYAQNCINPPLTVIKTFHKGKF